MPASATAVEEFSRWHETQAEPDLARYYRKLVPVSRPGPGEQYAFEVNLDQCTGCKACVVACHSLNGLDATESWRDVGLLLSRDESAYQQTITTACHHCAEPACADGCPVLAYDKDPVTGIVRHLDDQCIGCSYCILKCPYEVPKYNPKRGIVRKCDMCQGRLAQGEAPACVQACPTGAIAIRVVRKNLDPPPMLPGLVDSRYTLPQTRYVSAKKLPQNVAAADRDSLRVEAAHSPLAIMLVLTQLAAGLWLVAMFTAGEALRWWGFGITVLGIIASTLHLGQPLKAWRAFLGWRKSWLSREILAFGAFASAGFGAALGWLPVVVPTLLGAASVLCSVMVYVDTRRESWGLGVVTAKFVGTALLLGFAAAGLTWPALIVGVCKLGGEFMLLRNGSKSARLLRGPLSHCLWARFGTGLLGLVLLPWLPIPAVACLLAGELLERSLFFRSVVAHKMPGL